MTLNKETKHYEYNIDKMYTYLRGFLVGAGLTQSLTALQFAREAHKDQTRKNGTPYIVHPLSMACYAAALGLQDDNIIATILLHDVVEDCGVPAEHLPVGEVVRHAVRRMTITPFPTDKDKIETKRRYFTELLDSKEAVIGKAIDRYMNLTDMPFALSEDAIVKNVVETEELLLPILKQAKEKWAELSDVLFVLRTNIRSVNDILRALCDSEQYARHKSYYENPTTER